MRDYWLSKICFDLQDLALRAEYRADPDAVIARYPLKPEIAQALKDNNVEVLAPRLNPYLLRYYFGYAGMSDREFIGRVRGAAAPEGAYVPLDTAYGDESRG